MFKKVIAVSFTGVALYFVGFILLSQWTEIRGEVNSQVFIKFFSLATPVYILTAVVNALAWTYAYIAAGGTLAIKKGLYIHFVSQIGKYLPGNVGHFVGRLGLLKLIGGSLGTGSISIVLEILWLVGAASVLSVYALLHNAVDLVEVSGYGGGLLVGFLGLAIISPRLIILVFNGLPEGIRRKVGVSERVNFPPKRLVVGCYALYFITFFLNGLILIVGFYWLFGVSTINPLYVVSFYALVWLLGFVLPGAPGGIGVREALFVVLLGGMYGEGLAAAMAVIMRLVSVAGDLVVFGIGSLLIRGDKAS